jgi:hypothetical protein
MRGSSVRWCVEMRMQRHIDGRRRWPDATDARRARTRPGYACAEAARGDSQRTDGQPSASTRHRSIHSRATKQVSTRPVNHRDHHPGPDTQGESNGRARLLDVGDVAEGADGRTAPSHHPSPALGCTSRLGLAVLPQPLVDIADEVPDLSSDLNHRVGTPGRSGSPRGNRGRTMSLRMFSPANSQKGECKTSAVAARLTPLVHPRRPAPQRPASAAGHAAASRQGSHAARLPPSGATVRSPRAGGSGVGTYTVSSAGRTLCHAKWSAAS